jgi:DNA-binding transcriptional MocR family regulator
MEYNENGGINMPVNSFLDYPMSWKPNILKESKSIYIEIANALEGDIKRGLLKPGDKLPPQRELADFLDVNLSTITRAFAVCEMKGLISGTIGRGTFVASDVQVSSEILNDDIVQNCIDMGASHPLYEQNNYVTKTMQQILKKTNVDNLLKYSEPLGKMPHKINAQKWLRIFKNNTEIENIMITSGLQNSLAIILTSLFKRGDKIATNIVIYPGVKNISNMLGIRLIPIDFNRSSMDIEVLEQKCKLENINGIYLIPDHHNPTTLTMTKEERHAISEVIKKHNLICIEDATYSFLSDTKIEPISSIIPENSIYISTISNSLCAGLRISFLVVPEKFKNKIADGIKNVNVMASPFDSETVSKLIESGLALEIVKKKIDSIKNRNKITNSILDCFDIYGEIHSQFRWILLPKWLSGNHFEKVAKEKGVQVFCSERFAVGSNNISPAARIGICSPKSEDELIKGLNILKSVILE